MLAPSAKRREVFVESGVGRVGGGDKQVIMYDQRERRGEGENERKRERDLASLRLFQASEGKHVGSRQLD